MELPWIEPGDGTIRVKAIQSAELKAINQEGELIDDIEDPQYQGCLLIELAMQVAKRTVRNYYALHEGKYLPVCRVGAHSAAFTGVPPKYSIITQRALPALSRHDMAAIEAKLPKIMHRVLRKAGFSV
jgi:hypothetical protein